MTTPTRTPALRSAIWQAIEEHNKLAPVQSASFRPVRYEEMFCDRLEQALTPFLAPAPVDQAALANEIACHFVGNRDVSLDEGRAYCSALLARHFQSLATENKDSELEWLFERGEVTLGRSEKGDVMLHWRDKAYYGNTVEEAANAAMREGAK